MTDGKALEGRALVLAVALFVLCVAGRAVASRSLESTRPGGDDAVVAVVAVRSLAASGDMAALAQFLDRCVVTVPAGGFLMGNDDGPKNERPQRWVTLDGFEIDRFEVTNVQYRRFLQATGREPPPYWPEGDFPPGQADFPVVGVTWQDGEAYCGWIGKRLPTEAEWEKACRSTDGRIYPWGDAWDASRASVGTLGEEGTQPVGYTEPGPVGWGDDWASVSQAPAGPDAPGLRAVGSYREGASPYGVMDMVGNASEWVADWYNWDGYWDLTDRNPVGLGPEWNRSLRGSSWVPYRVAGWSRDRSRCSARDSTHRGTPDARFGFRCARSLQ